MNSRQIFGVSENATPTEVKARWRQLAKEHHPDAGGTDEEFNKVRAQYEKAYAESIRPSKCTNCDGTGKVAKQNGFHMIRQRCKVCSGRGRIMHSEHT